VAFTSKLYPGEMVIDDGTPAAVTDPPPGQRRGLNLKLRTDEGYAGVADLFPSELLIPRSEWQARIQEMEERKSRLSDISLAAGLPHKDQNGTNYCWINAPVHCVEIVRVIQNEPMVILSPASCGGPIKNFRNDGGWGKEGLEYIIAHGIVPADKWPANAISRSYWTEENKRLALRYRVTEWWELRPRNLDQLITCLLLRLPVAVGYNWWRHEVTGCDAVWLDNTVALRIRNSWKAWGENGFGVLQGSKMLPDDAVVPRVALAA
jgi:hypothetical protein